MDTGIIQTISFPKPCCPTCRSSQLRTYRSEAIGDGRLQYVRCECGTRFKLLLDSCWGRTLVDGKEAIIRTR